MHHAGGHAAVRPHLTIKRPLDGILRGFDILKKGKEKQAGGEEELKESWQSWREDRRERVGEQTVRQFREVASEWGVTRKKEDQWCFCFGLERGLSRVKGGEESLSCFV